MREGPVKRIVLALLMLTILSTYLYLQIRGYRELRLPQEQSAAVSAVGQPQTQAQPQNDPPSVTGAAPNGTELQTPAAAQTEKSPACR